MLRGAKPETSNRKPERAPQGKKAIDWDWSYPQSRLVTNRRHPTDAELFKDRRRLLPAALFTVSKRIGSTVGVVDVLIAFVSRNLDAGQSKLSERRTHDGGQ